MTQLRDRPMPSINALILAAIPNGSRSQDLAYRSALETMALALNDVIDYSAIRAAVQTALDAYADSGPFEDIEAGLQGLDTKRLGMLIALVLEPDGKEGSAVVLASDMLHLGAQPEDPEKARSELLACVDLAIKLLETK